MRLDNALTLIWDALATILIALPLLTGGIWIKRPHLFLELSDLSVPVLILGVFTALTYRKIDWTKSWVATVARTLWVVWKSSLDQAPARTLLTASFAFGATWALASLRRHWACESHTFDLGIFTNLLWNVTHGLGYVSAPKNGINLFQDHQSPISLLIAPIFWVASTPETLLILQALGLALTGTVLFPLARQYFPRGHWLPAALPLAFWLYRPIRNANAFDFHPEVLMLPFFLAGVWLLQSRSYRALGALSLLLALMCKESAGVVAFGIGAAWLLGAGPSDTRKFTRPTGLVVALLGAAVFAFDYKIVPGFFGTQYSYNALYDQYTGVWQSLLLLPQQLFGISRLKFLAAMIAPFGFVPFLGWRALVAAVPPWLMLFLSKGDHRVNMTYHYSIESMTAVLWSVVLGFRALEGRSKLRHAGIYLLFFTLLMTGRSEAFRIRIDSPTPHARWLSTELIPAVRPGVSLAASDALVPHLSLRPWVHTLDRLQTTSAPVDCVLLDREVGNWPLSDSEIQALVENLPTLGYREVLRCGEFRAFERAGGCFTRLARCAG